MPKGNRAVIYARFSSDLQKDRSIEDQFAVCRPLACREGLEVLREFSDRAKSGATLFERDGLIELMRTAKERRFDVLIVESLDRLSRDQEDLAGLFKRLCFYGIEIRTLNEGVATSLHVGIRGLLGSLFLADLGNKVRRGLAGRVREGKIPGSVPYGYRKVLGKPGEREIDTEQAEIVRRIFREYIAGKSPRKIAFDLNRDGVPSPRKGAWNALCLSGGKSKGVLNNQLYRGEIHWNTTRAVINPETGKKTSRPADPSEFIVIPAPHLRIIDEGTWQAAAAAREQRGWQAGPVERRRPTVSRKRYLLADLLRCAICGGPMTILVRKRVTCRSGFLNGVCVHRRSYDVARLTMTVVDNMREQLNRPASIERATQEFREEWAALQRDRREDSLKVGRRLASIDVGINRLVEALEKDLSVPVATITDKLRALQIEREGLQEKMELLAADTASTVVVFPPHAIKHYQHTIDSMHAALSRGDPVSEECRDMFRNIVRAVEVHPITGHAPYEVTISLWTGSKVRQQEGQIAPAAAESGEGPKFVSANSGLPTLAQTNFIALPRWQERAA